MLSMTNHPNDCRSAGDKRRGCEKGCDKVSGSHGERGEAAGIQLAALRFSGPVAPPLTRGLVPHQLSSPIKDGAQCLFDLDDVQFSGRSRVRSNLDSIQEFVAIKSWSGTSPSQNSPTVRSASISWEPRLPSNPVARRQEDGWPPMQRTPVSPPSARRLSLPAAQR